MTPTNVLARNSMVQFSSAEKDLPWVCHHIPYTSSTSGRYILLSSETVIILGSHHGIIPSMNLRLPKKLGGAMQHRHLGKRFKIPGLEPKSKRRLNQCLMSSAATNRQPKKGTVWCESNAFSEVNFMLWCFLLELQVCAKWWNNTHPRVKLKQQATVTHEFRGGKRGCRSEMINSYQHLPVWVRWNPSDGAWLQETPLTTLLAPLGRSSQVFTQIYSNMMFEVWRWLKPKKTLTSLQSLRISRLNTFCAKCRSSAGAPVPVLFGQKVVGRHSHCSKWATWINVRFWFCMFRTWKKKGISD